MSEIVKSAPQNGEILPERDDITLPFAPRRLLFSSLASKGEVAIDQLLAAITGDQAAIWDHLPAQIAAVECVVMSGEEVNQETGELVQKTRLYLVDKLGQCWVTASGPAVSDFFTILQFKGPPNPTKPLSTLWKVAKCRNGKTRLCCTVEVPSQAAGEPVADSESASKKSGKK